MVRSQVDGALRKASTLAIGTDGHAEVVLHAAVPGFVVGSVQVHPFFVSHGLAPAEKWQRIGSNRVPQLPGSAKQREITRMVATCTRDRAAAKDAEGLPPSLRGNVADVALYFSVCEARWMVWPVWAERRAASRMRTTVTLVSSELRSCCGLRVPRRTAVR